MTLSDLNANIGDSDVAAQPKSFFGVRIEGGSATIEGSASCLLGQRIPVAGQMDDEGVFVDWHWNGKRLQVTNDRYGLYPLFYCAKKDSIFVSPSLERVVLGNSDRKLDFPALGIFRRLGHFVGSDTPFADVRFLPPNCTLSWESGRLELVARPAPAGAPRGPELSFDVAAEQYQTLFAQSIARRLPSDDAFAVPLSGGRDSRHILLELVRQGHRPRFCATVKYRPPATNEDFRIARLITGRLDIPHIEIDRPASFFQASLKDVHLTNHCGGGHGWVQPVAARLSGDVGTTYDGLAGEVLSAGFMQSQQKNDLFRSQRFEALGRLILDESCHEDVIQKVLSPDAYRSIPMDAAIERLVSELKKHQGAPNPLLSFLFWNRTRRCIASIPFAIFHQLPKVHVPFLDHALFDFLFSLDASMVEGNRLHDETIRRSYPDFADIPYENKALRPTFTPADRSYYPQARKEFYGYLRDAPAAAIEVVNRAYLYSKIGIDLLLRRVEPPWYMRTALQAIELERLRVVP